MDTLRYIFGVLLVITMPPALLWWFVVHPFVGFWRRLGVKTSMAVLTVAALAGAGGLFTVHHRLLGRDLGTHWPLVAAAVVLLGLAATLAVKRKRQLTFRILAGIPVIHALVLLEERELLDRFGDEYVEYSRAVPRYIPRLDA